MFRLLVFIAFLTTAFALPRAHPRLGRIIGGENTTIEEHPYQVSIEVYGEHECAGTIIGPKHILTTYFCTTHGESHLYTVRAGSSFIESGGLVVRIAKIIQHPNEPPLDKDIAILELIKELPFGKLIQPINLATVEPSTDTSGVIVGWGYLELYKANEASMPLQKLTVNVIDRNECKEIHGNGITSNTICATSSNGDFCLEDQGGSLVINGELAGIMSSTSCGSRPGVYTNVAAFTEWIIENTQ